MAFKKIRVLQCHFLGGSVGLKVLIFSQIHLRVLISVSQSKNSISLGLAEKNASLVNLPFATLIS